MSTIERNTYNGSLSESFFTISPLLYNQLPFRPSEDKAVVSALFAMESERNEIINYTNHSTLRLTGIFPAGEEVAYFGFWETVNDAALNKEAFAMLEADAAERNRKSIIGPIKLQHLSQLQVTQRQYPFMDYV